MLPALIIVFREGFEAFLSVAIILTYLRKTGRDWLRPAVHAGIVASLIASAALGWLLWKVIDSQKHPLLEGILGIVAAVLVATFVIHVWRVAPHMKRDMEVRLEAASSGTSRAVAIAAVFGITVLMVAREGMETALMLMQVRTGRFILGSFIGLGLAALMSWAWAQYGHRLDVKRFFQVTGLFLLLFTFQILLFAIHELSEAGVLPNSDAIHHATEPYSPVGLYGKWMSVAMVGICAAWLAGVTLRDRMLRRASAA